MILVKDEKIKIIGSEVDICCELGFLIDGLIRSIGENKTKEIIKNAYESVIETNKEMKVKKQKDKNKLKKDLKNHLPKDIAEILCNLL